jgi:uncharacterized protein
MKSIDYFAIIHKYVPPDSPVYAAYLTHATLVTAKALRSARHLGLSKAQQRFIEEAAMLHDIGVVRVKPFLESKNGDAPPYICHAPIGREMLEQEGLPRHALVAERHVGVGLSKEDIIWQELPLPHRDMLPETLEEQVICWADLFFSKKRNYLWQEFSIKEIETSLSRYGERKIQVFREWLSFFGR